MEQEGTKKEMKSAYFEMNENENTSTLQYLPCS